MCVVVTMNLLNPLSEYGLVSCDYILYYYVCSYELVCEVVNYYHGLQLLVLLSFVYCFHILMSGFFYHWVSTGRLFPFWLSVDRSFLTHIYSNCFVFDIP